MAYKGTVTVCGVLDFCVYLQTKIRICFFQWNLFYCILSSIKFVFHLKRKKQKVTSVLSFILNNCPRSMMIKTFTYSQSYDQVTNLENTSKASFTKSYDLNKLLLVTRSSILQKILHFMGSRQAPEETSQGEIKRK